MLGALAYLPGAGTPASALPPFPPSEPTTPQADGSVPAHQVTVFAATPEEAGAPGSYETWGLGALGGRQHVLVRYFDHQALGGEEGSWTLGPALPAGFLPAEGELAAAMTPRGFGAMVGEAQHSESVLTRRPGGSFESTALVRTEGETLEPGEEALLKKGEALFASSRAPLLAPLEEAAGAAGALVVPVVEAKEASVESQVLHWDGHAWSSEPIEIPARSASDFRVLALAADAPNDAWLLAQLARSTYPQGSVALFRRVEASVGHWSWKPVALSAGPGDGEAHPLSVPLQGSGSVPFTVAGIGEPPTVLSPLLTVSSQGVWVDGRRSDVRDAHEGFTSLFFKPEGTAGGSVQTSFCPISPEAKLPCLHQLPEAPVGQHWRSFAWADSAEPYGQRVLTGLREGVSLRLEGENFKPMLALGAGHSSGETPGAQYGAAFSDPTEGWLGQALLPVHLTEHPATSRLSPWPVPFRTPLLAIAGEPGAPVGSLQSEAIAVGDGGEVAHYRPGKGWLPESLFGPSERVESEVQLRSVAWPRPARAYAVGDHGQMWLWRAETGLWERDPATPLNFRDNMLGIAFDPENPAIGYAVGTSEVGVGGALLRYGKTWTQETDLPPQVQGAAFTSVAFAGSEAIVAYRKQPNPESQTFVGGLLVNDGSGWQVDEQAAAAMGPDVPRTVAGLPDGGAAVITEGEVDHLYEREGPNSPWQATAVPPPGGGTSLSLFREAGALRAIVAGGGTGNVALQPAVPPGFPPDLYGPIGAQNAGPETPVVLRQTAISWSDDSHELDPIKQPEGGYHAEWDAPYTPDPIGAVLIDPTGTQGWAVGGVIGSRAQLETADIERYPADGSQPPGAGEEAKVPLEAEDATLAIGGHAECANPCGARARAGVGPQVWLRSAYALASKIGVPAFLYTGPSVSEAAVEGPERSVPLPFAQELERTAEILSHGIGSTGAYAVATPQDRDARPEGTGDEQLFKQSFAGLPEPLGSAAAPHGVTPVRGAPHEPAATCASQAGCQAEYYAMDVTASGNGKAARVIVLDDSSGVGSEQLLWLEGQLEGAELVGEPAIVVGDADLAARLAAGEQWALQVATLLVDGSKESHKDGASAYFYDSPEEDVHKPLRVDGGEIETFGSGTLGYQQVVGEEKTDFHGASGILLAQVDLAPGAYSPLANSNRAPVSVRLIPLVGELALEAGGGTLLRRSQATLFSGLARRPRAGGVAINNSEESQVDPYVPIPEECVGTRCAVGLFPEYTFRSSNTEVGDFVQRNTASASPLAVLQGPDGRPIPDPHSGLFCAYNAGTTTVTIEAGGLSASLPIAVQPGSVREPCGTVPLKNLPAGHQGVPATTPPPAPTPAGAQPAPASTPPPIPIPPPPSVPLPPARVAAAPHPPPPFVPLAAAAAPVLAFVPPPIPTPARPSPPTGTSAVTSPIEVAEKEEEEESATESASAQAVAYRSTDDEPATPYLLGILLLAGFAGASVRRPRRGRRGVRVAPATISTMRAQRRMERRSRPRR